MIATNSTNSEGLIQFDSVTTPGTYVVKIVQVKGEPIKQQINYSLQHYEIEC